MADAEQDRLIEGAKLLVAGSRRALEKLAASRKRLAHSNVEIQNAISEAMTALERVNKLARGAGSHPRISN